MNAISPNVTVSGGDSTTSGSLLNFLSTVTGSADAIFDPTLSGSTIVPTGPLSVSGSLTLDTSLLGSSGSITVNVGSNAISATSLIAAGPGTLSLGGNGTNYSGTISITGSGELLVSSAIGAAGSLTFDFSQSNASNSQNATLKGTSGTIGGDTIKDFQLSDQLVISGTVKSNTTATLSGTVLTVTDSTDSVLAVFTLSGSLTDDGANGDETIGMLRETSTGAAVITPAMLVKDSIGDDTGAFSLRHALSVVSAKGGIGDMVLFDDSLNGKTITVGPATLINNVLTANPLAVPSTTVRLAVESGDSVTISGADSLTLVGGLHATSGFLKVGGGKLTLAGDELGIAGIMSVSSGTLDIETATIGGSLAFKTGIDATIAGTSATLNGKTVSTFLPGDTIKINDIDFAGSTSLSSTVAGGAGTLQVSESLPEGGSTSVQLALAASSLSGLSEGFVLLRDSSDGSAFIRPSIIALTDADLVAAVATLTGSTFSGTSFDVIDLAAGGAFGTSSVALGSNPILFNVGSGVSNTLSENLSGTSDFWKTGTGKLTLTGNDSGLGGTASIGGGTLVIGTSNFSSAITALDMASGRSTVEATAANLTGLHVTNFHLGDAIHFVAAASSDTIISSFSNALTSSLSMSLTDQATGATVNGSITLGLAADSRPWRR